MFYFEKMYKLYPHNRNLSVATNFSNYHRLSNGDKHNDEERKIIVNKIEIPAAI